MTKVKVRLTVQISDMSGQHQHSITYPMRTKTNIPFIEALDNIQDRVMKMKKHDKFIFVPDKNDNNSIAIVTRIE